MLACLFVSGFSCLISAGEVGTDDIQIEMVEIRNTNIKFPRLAKYSDTQIMDRINEQIEALTATFGCEKEKSTSETETYFKVQSSVEYGKNMILSIYASASYYCAGPYPTNDSNLSLTFDLRSGEKISFAQLFKDYESDMEPILEIIFSEQIKKSETLMDAGKEADGTCQNDPDLFSLEHLEESTFNFYFSDKGLIVQPEWPHVIESCAERVLVPYKALEPFVAPDGIFAIAAGS